MIHFGAKANLVWQPMERIHPVDAFALITLVCLNVHNSKGKALSALILIHLAASGV